MPTTKEYPMNLPTVPTLGPKEQEIPSADEPKTGLPDGGGRKNPKGY